MEHFGIVGDKSKKWVVGGLGFAFLCATFLAFVALPRYEYRTRVDSPDGMQALMVYVQRPTWFTPIIGAPGDWAYRPAYAVLVDAENTPLSGPFFRRCVVQLGDLFTGTEYRAEWRPRTVEIAKFAQINRETGRAEC